MDVLLEALKNPGNMSNQQWLLVAIILFVLAGSAFFVYRVIRIIATERKSSYVPNIGRKRLDADKTGRHTTGATTGNSTDASSGIEQDKIE